MNCIRCGKLLDAEAHALGACQYCGQAIQVHTFQSPTSNVPGGPPAWSSADTATITFLPGTPPSGTIPPPRLPSSPLSSASAYPPAAPARPQRRRTLILAAVAAFVLVAMITGGLLFAQGFPTMATSISGTPTAGNPAAPAPSPTPTLPPMQVYADPNGLFTISYPAGWTAQDISQKLGNLPITLLGVQFQGGNASLKIFSGKQLPLIPDQATKVNIGLLQLMGTHNITSADPKGIGGQDWTTREAIDSNSDKVVAASTARQGELYTIIYSAPPDEFDQDETEMFTPMLESFAFGA